MSAEGAFWTNSPAGALGTANRMVRIYGNVEALGGPPRKDPGEALLEKLVRNAREKRIKEKLLLYIHVPFCRSKCGYCAFHSRTHDEEARARYVTLLLSEIELWSRRLNRPEVGTVYFGGGTPSLLPLQDFSRIFNQLAKSFSVETGLETTVEANPESAQDPSYYRGLASMGVNRLSLGVQSLDDEMLTLLGRPHTAAMARTAYSSARAAGFANIGLDFIWGLPGQRAVDWVSQLKHVTKRMRPEHLSCYGLTLEENTPFAARCAAGELALPPEEEQARMFIHGAELLESEGFIQYEISNYARMGFISRHNSGYWQGLDFLGLGPSAVSTLGTRRLRNPVRLDEYDAAVRGGFLGHDYESLDKTTRQEERLMLGLRTTSGVDLKKWGAESGRDILAEKRSMIHALHRNHLVKLNKGKLQLTKNGMLVSNSIIQRLLE